MHINTETASLTSVTLTIGIGVWFFRATRCLDIANICAKLFENPSKDYKNMDPTRKMMNMTFKVEV